MTNVTRASGPAAVDAAAESSDQGSALPGRENGGPWGEQPGQSMGQPLGETLGDRLGAELSRMRSDIEVLQREGAQRRPPWYRQASVLIALVALLLSATSTFYAEQRSSERDDAAARVQLSQLIQQMTALPKENAEIQAQYADEPEVLSRLGGAITTENLALAQHAAALIEQIPDRVTATEYYAVAQALLDSGVLDKAAVLIEAGLGLETDAATRAALLRTKGAVGYASGDVDGARRAMNDALAVYASQRQEVAATANAYTELLWAVHEKSSGNCSAAEDHVETARGYLIVLPPTAYTDQVRRSLDNLDISNLGGCD